MIQLGKLQLGIDPLRDFFGRTDQPGWNVLPIRRERPDHPIVSRQRNHHDPPDETVDPVAAHIMNLRAPVPQRDLGVREPSAAW